MNLCSVTGNGTLNLMFCCNEPLVAFVIEHHDCTLGFIGEQGTECGVISATNHDFLLHFTITFDLFAVEKFQRYPLKA